MITYKITNITSTFNKRDVKFNSIVNIDYVDNMMQKHIKIMPNNVAYLTIGSLPIVVSKLSMSGVIDVVELTDKQFEDISAEHKARTKPNITTTIRPPSTTTKPVTLTTDVSTEKPEINKKTTKVE